MVLLAAKFCSLDCTLQPSNNLEWMVAIEPKLKISKGNVPIIL